ncbi:hypothetical protein [Cellulomonas sp. B6]|uniref:hypothetical protein n=1 Tax=Cellulomonas sp. B6 TaxID=1295626 RepID=UPI00073BFECC|nr:hypothetical protein [Cellulomonas sp. B6]KSW30237.1 hypothetical protein ATM99_04000 [Cellulomonas sp. B6]
MLDFTRGDAAALLDETVAPVVTELRTHGVSPDALMLYGAVCRDLLHAAAGHVSRLRRTGDLDLAIVVTDLEAYRELTQSLQGPHGASAYRFLIRGRPVDLIPFGGVERPRGVGPCQENVLGYQEVHAGARPISSQHPDLGVRVPSVPGYVALKLSAWAHRRDVRDAEDLKYALFWYRENPDVVDRLYDLEADVDVVEQLAGRPEAGLVHLLVRDAHAVLGTEAAAGLRDLWSAEAPNAVARVAPLARAWAKADLDGWRLTAREPVDLAAHVDLAVMLLSPVTLLSVADADRTAESIDL